MKFSMTNVYKDELIIYLLKDGLPIHCFTEHSFVDFIFGYARYIQHCDAFEQSDHISDDLIYEFKTLLCYDTDNDIMSLTRFDEPFLFFPKPFADYFRTCKDFNALDFVMELSTGLHSACVGGSCGGVPPSSADAESIV